MSSTNQPGDSGKNLIRWRSLVVIKVSLKSRNTKSIASMEMQQLHQNIDDLLNGTKPWSKQTHRFISELKDEGVEILNSQLDRQTVIIWIWCRTQSALEYIQSLYESNQLQGKLSAIIDSFISTTTEIEWNQFKKTVVDFPISINFSQRIDVEINESVRGVTKLGNTIYVLCRAYYRGLNNHSIIRVFEDRNPFRPKKNIEINCIKNPEDIGSCQTENVLYVCASGNVCIWKVTIAADDEHKIIKWLSVDYTPFTLSVSSDGQLLVIDRSSSILNIHGTHVELIRSFEIERDPLQPVHAVKTSIGHIIILYRWEYKVISSKDERVGKDRWETQSIMHELTEDGQTTIRRFIPSNEEQRLHDPVYLSLDSDDRVIVADYTLKNESRVILFDSNLN